MRFRCVFMLVGAAALVARLAHGAADAEPSPDDDGVTQQTVDVAAAPDVVYAVLTDYRQWPTHFTQVREASVLDESELAAKVRLTTRRFRSAYTIAADNVPSRLVRLRLLDGDSGTQVRAWMRIEPTDHGARVRVTACTRLGGALSFFFPDFVVRRIQGSIVDDVLADLRRAAERARAPAPAK